MEKKPRKKHIKYSEGQWFAVPLKSGGYALGIIARGSHKVKGLTLAISSTPGTLISQMNRRLGTRTLRRQS